MYGLMSGASGQYSILSAFCFFYNLFRLLLFENTNVTFMKIITSLALADSRTTYKLYYTVHKAAFSVGLFEDRISTLSK